MTEIHVASSMKKPMEKKVNDIGFVMQRVDFDQNIVSKPKKMKMKKKKKKLYRDDDES